MSEETWLRDILNETETEIKSWPAWLKASSVKNPPSEPAEDPVETSADDDNYEELDQQVG